jgi:hypothetical protein
MLQAYSRDPHLLLNGESWPTPGVGACLYKEPTLRVDLGPCKAGTRLHAVLVDWEIGSVALYASAQDRLNRTPLFEARDAWPSLPTAHADEYVRQVYAYLLRGHSLRAPGCRCVSGQQCVLGSSCAWPRLTDVAQELCVRSLRGRVEVMRRGKRIVRMPLLRVLTELAGLQLTPDGQRIGTPACCLPLTITSADDVLRAAELLAPRPYLYDPSAFDPLTQSEVQRGLDHMQKQLHVRVLASDTEGVLAVFFNKRWLHFECATPAAASELWARCAGGPPPPPPDVAVAKEATKRRRPTETQRKPKKPRFLIKLPTAATSKR